jgi:TolB-like protein/DNA-binding winged helix-turn-helix (wHTH) protein/Tfp pilus assembly protein PilF
MPESVKQAIYEFGDFRVDAEKRLLWRGNEQIALTPKVFDTLLTLIDHRDEVIDKERLMALLWPDSFVEESNIVQNIAVLRKALGENPKQHRFILTVPGRGYRFIADTHVTKGNGSDRTEDIETIQPASFHRIGPEDHHPAPVGSRTTVAGMSARWAIVLGVGAIVLVGVATWFLSTRLFSSPPPRSITSLVVLPLENLSGDPSQEYFADGMTDTLIGELARVKGLQVISRTSAVHYKGSKQSLREIAGELKVDAVVEGTVQRVGDRVLIRAQLIEAATDKHLLSESYERDLSDVLSLQNEIAQAIVREIQFKLLPSDRPGTPHRLVNRKAFDDYLQGRFLMSKGRTNENLYKAIEFFESALKEDPAYASPYAGLADCYNFLGTVIASALPPREARRRAEEAAVKALEIDSEIAEAHAALGFVKHYNWDWAGAEQEFKRAIELNPSLANAHNFYAGFLISTGRTEEAIAAINRAQELDPFSLSISAQRGFILECARRYDEAIEQLRRVIAMDQNHFQAHWYLGHTYAANGQISEAIEESEKAVAISRTPGALGFLGMHYGLAGRRDEAEKVLNELLALNRHRYVTPPAFVHVYLGLGDKEKAFFWLEKAFQDRSNYMAYLKPLPANDPLRSDPRFNELLRRMNLTP